MKEKIKIILIGVLIGLIALPTITFGGSFVSSLIQGKTVEEAIQILAEQIDILIGRVEVVETKQAELETKRTEQERLEACEFANTVLTIAQIQGGIIDADLKSFDDLISKIIYQRDNSPQNQYQMWQPRLEKVQILKEQYLSAKAKCELEE
jgi:hypothetical protein